MAFLKRLFGFGKTAKPLKIIILGLDQAGKTSFLNYLRLQEFTNPVRTMGLNMEEVKVDGLKLDVLDLGGQNQFRTTLWPKILETGTDVVMYIVDSSDRERLMMNNEEFSKLIDHPRLISDKTPIIVLANKQDLGGCLSPGEISLELELIEHSLTGRSFQVIPTSMITGMGVDEVLQHLKVISDKKNE